MVMRPPDRDFCRAQAVALGKEKDFGVKSESFDTLLFENNSRSIPPECFESTLGIVKRQTGKESYQAIEDEPRQFTKARLMNVNHRAVDSARTDRDIISSTNRGQKLLGFLDGGGQVGVGEKCNAAARFKHAVAHAVAFSAISVI